MCRTPVIHVFHTCNTGVYPTYVLIYTYNTPKNTCNTPKNTTYVIHVCVANLAMYNIHVFTSILHSFLVAIFVSHRFSLHWSSIAVHCMRRHTFHKQFPANIVICNVTVSINILSLSQVVNALGGKFGKNTIPTSLP